MVSIGCGFAARCVRFVTPQAGIAFEQRDSCFVGIEEVARAQQMLADSEQRKWERWLKMLSVRVNPLVSRSGGLDLYPYYWSVLESEYATDVMFPEAQALSRIYPASVYKVVLNGQFLLKGFANRDMWQRLEPGPTMDVQERRRVSGRTTRLLRLLRAHDVIRKVRSDSQRNCQRPRSV
ncbi:MAG: hypothetical protein ABFE13_25165 [Phycisphaerales bacterium]